MSPSNRSLVRRRMRGGTPRVAAARRGAHPPGVATGTRRQGGVAGSRRVRGARDARIGARARRDGRGRAARARREFRDGSRGEARREWTGRGRGPKGARARRGRGASFGTGRAATARREARDGSRGEGPARVDGTGSEAEGRGARGEGAVRGALGRPPGGRMSGCSAWVRVTHHSRAGAGVASSVDPLKAAARGGGGRLPDGPVRTGRGTCLEGPIEWSRRREAPMMRQRPDLCAGGRRREARPPFRQR